MRLKSYLTYSITIWSLWLIGFITGIYILFMYFKEQNGSLLGAFAILISAFLASVTMSRSFHQTKEEHELKLRQIKRKAIYATLELMFNVLEPENCPEYTLDDYLELVDRIENSGGILDDESYVKLITVMEEIVAGTRLNPKKFEEYRHKSLSKFIDSYNEIIDICENHHFNKGVYIKLDYYEYLKDIEY